MHACMHGQLAGARLPVLPPKRCGPLAPCPKLAGRASEEAVCRATMSLLHVVLGLLVPLAVSVYSWQQLPPTQQRERHNAARVCQGGLSKLVHAADRWLHQMLGGSTSWGMRSILLWYVFSNCWLLAKVSLRL